MTIINVNSISGINSITAQGASGIEFYDSSGNSVHTVTSDTLTVGTGASVHNPASNVLTLGTNNEERLRIEGGGQIGIGTINPNTLLHVYGGTVKIQSDEASTGQYDLLRLQSGSTGGAVLKVFAEDASDNNTNFTFKTNANENISFDIGTTTNVLTLINGGDVGIGTDNPTVKLSIGAGFDTTTASGYGIGNKITEVANNRTGCIQLQADGFNNAYYPVLEIYNGSTRTAHFKADGNLVLQNGSGIDFSATADGTGGSNINEVLDDYEKGTFTPTFNTTNNDIGSITYDSANTRGTYVKIGKKVFITLVTRTTAVSGTGSGNLTITGLPFSVDNTIAERAVCSVGEIGSFGSWGTAPSNTNPPTIWGLNYINMFIASSSLSTGNPGNFFLLTGTYITSQ